MTPAITPDQTQPDINDLPEDEQALVHLGLHPMQVAIAQHIASGGAPSPMREPTDPQPDAAPAAPAIARPQSGARPINVPSAPSETGLPATTNAPQMSAVAPAAPTHRTEPEAHPYSKYPYPVLVHRSEITPTHRTELEAQQQQLDKGSGIAQFQQRHHIVGGVARVAAGIGSALFPGIAEQIPGTDMHHQMLVDENERELQNENALDTGRANRAHTQSEIGHEQAQTGHEVAETDALKNPQPADKTPLEDVYRKLATQVNPATGKTYTPLEAFRELQAVTEKVGEPDKPLGNVDQMNQALTRRFQVLHPAQTLPQEYTLPPNAKNGDYSRIDESLKNEEAATGTKQTHDSADADRAENRADRQQRQAQMDAEKHQKERDSFSQPLQPAIDNAQAMKQYADSGAHTGIGDYQMMLQFQESLTSGAKAGIRFNTGEQALIQHAQNLENSIRAKWGHLTGGTSFSDEQRHEIADAMQHVAAVHQQAIDRWDRQHGGAAQQAPAGGTTQPSAGGKTGAPSTGAGGGAPQGATMKVPGSDGKMHWSDGKKDLGIAQ